MTCDHLHLGDTCVTICRTAMREAHREPDRVRWCFRCRKHLLHDFVVTVTVEPSYYGPSYAYECPECHGDRTLFPGAEREWEEV